MNFTFLFKNYGVSRALTLSRVTEQAIKKLSDLSYSRSYYI
jgi:hypothetical protein